MNSFSMISLLGLKLIPQLFDTGECVLPVIKHLEFLTKKSTFVAYRSDAYVGNNRAVVDGPRKMVTEEVAINFCAENLYPQSIKNGPVKQQASKKNTRYCMAVYEGACTFCGCGYSHTCRAYGL